jgi:hypothetical protein
MHKKRAEKTQEEAITRNPTKKINKKIKKDIYKKNSQSKPSMAFLFLSGLRPKPPPHQPWPPLSAEQTSPTITIVFAFVSQQ